MRVLTDWIEGTPLKNRPGMYIAAERDCRHMPELMRWNGQQWLWLSGSETTTRWTHFRGLAFDPASAEYGTLRHETRGGIKRTGWFVPEVPR